MAPKKRENNFFDVGVQGRKTGITLQDTGVRDEHGLEPIEGIFSSPEKPSPKPASARRGDATIIESEEMEIQRSSMPEPTETLSMRKLTRSAKTNLPPKSRSPIKTALGSSPRRQSSMGPPGGQRNTATPSRAASHPAVRRKLDFTESQISVEESSLEEINGVGGNDVYAIPQSPVRRAGRQMNKDIEDLSEQLQVEETGEDEFDIPAMEDDALQASIANGEASLAGHDESIVQPPSSPPVPKSKGRKRKFDLVQEVVEADADARAAKSLKNTARGGRKPIVAAPAPVKSGRRTRSSLPESSEIQDSTTMTAQAASESILEPEPEPEPEPVRQPAKKGRAAKPKPTVPKTRVVEEPSVVDPPVVAPKRRGRPPKQRDVSVLQDEPPQASASTSMLPPAKAKKRGPKERDANAKIAVRKSPGKSRMRSASVAPSEMSMQSTFSTRSNVRHISVRPTEEDDYQRSRFGRALRKPLASWRGEKDVFSHNHTLIESQLTEEVELEKLKRGRPKGKKRQDTIVEELEPEELEEWEQDPGILTGMVNVWDHDAENVNGEREEDIAFAGPSIVTNPVSNAEFKYTRICGVRFFNAGMVDLPSYSEKKRKNSRRMHMVFYVLKGTVQVTVGENPEFTINKGGVWQVPRGNLYSIRNIESGEAKVFFSQACRMRDDEEED